MVHKVSKQPSESVTVKQCKPAAKPVILEVVCPVEPLPAHTKLYPFVMEGVPPVITAVRPPSDNPLHEALESTVIPAMTIADAGSVILTHATD